MTVEKYKEIESLNDEIQKLKNRISFIKHWDTAIVLNIPNVGTGGTLRSNWVSFIISDLNVDLSLLESKFKKL
jgi:hypothetical protein